MNNIDLSDFAFFCLATLFLVVQWMTGVGLFIERRRVQIVLRSMNRDKFRLTLAFWLVLAIVALIYGFVVSHPPE